MLRWMLAAAISASVIVPAVPASAAIVPVPLTYAKQGDIWLDTGEEHFRVTLDGGNSWPRLSPDRSRIAYLHEGDIWLANVGNGSEFVSTEQLTRDGESGAAAWSPHGDYLAYRSGSVYTGTLYLVRVGTDAHESMPERFHSAPVGEPVAVRQLDGGLGTANTIAWSPDGLSLAFPGGECWGIYDDCLTLLDLHTNAERTIAAFAGGGAEQSGYATTPAFSQDSTRLFYTQQIEDGPVQILAQRLADKNRWQIGEDGASIPVPMGHGKFLVVGSDGWITFLSSGGRKRLVQGTQPDWRP